MDAADAEDNIRGNINTSLKKTNISIASQSTKDARQLYLEIDGTHKSTCTVNKVSILYALLFVTIAIGFFFFQTRASTTR